MGAAIGISAFIKLIAAPLWFCCIFPPHHMGCCR